MSHHHLHPQWKFTHLLLFLLNLTVVLGNFVVIFVVLFDRKLRVVTTNKFIASLAISDLLVGTFVMPLSLYSKIYNDEWNLGFTWCQLHLVSGVFSSTASIVHLVAISLDRYFAIMFPTEYQRHSVSTGTFPYIIMMWLMALAVSSTLLMERENKENPLTWCWITSPQYIALSSLLSFFLPGAIVVYMYVKIFRKLRHHQLYMFGQSSTNRLEKKRSLPRVIIEEVRSRRGSRLSQTGSNSGSPTRRSSGGSGHKAERSPSQPEIHSIALPPQRWRSPTICAETFEHDRQAAAKKRVSIVPDPPSMDISSVSNMAHIRQEHESAKERENEMKIGKEKDENETAGNEVLRKLSEERRYRREERRKSSTDARQLNGIGTIMEAFDKAFAQVSRERRNSDSPTSPFGLHPFPSHPSLKPSLSTVRDEDSVQSNEEIEVCTVITTADIETTGRKSPVPVHVPLETIPVVTSSTLTAPLIVPSLDDSIEIESSVDEPLLKKEEIEQQQTPLLSVPIINRRPSKSNGGILKSRNCSYTSSLIPPPTFLMVPAIMSINNTPPLSPIVKDSNCLLKVPRMYDCPSPTACDIPPSNSSHSSYTSASGSSETYRRISMNSFGSSLTEGTESSYDADSRRSSAWSTLRAAVLNDPRRGKKSLVDMDIDRTGGQKKMSTISRGKLRRIATQVTRAIRRKRRESLAIRRESRATRVVAAILVAFLLCWTPYYIILVYRGIVTGYTNAHINQRLHHQFFIHSSWLGYAHSAFNPIIYMCLNKNFRQTMGRLFEWINSKRI
uniref:Dop-5 n=1 Tax=Pristionchus pacificus TaxID=54126 RepID=A0A2A6CA79_PRIPA|eukprot:PDM74963.1 dop-5 [Pristionchus pacificus]